KFNVEREPFADEHALFWCLPRKRDAVEQVLAPEPRDPTQHDDDKADARDARLFGREPNEEQEYPNGQPGFPKWHGQRPIGTGTRCRSSARRSSALRPRSRACVERINRCGRT